MAACDPRPKSCLQVTSTSSRSQRSVVDDGNQKRCEGADIVGETSTPGESHEKPMIVRVKRKRVDEPIENIWLEVSHPAKCQELLFNNFTLDDNRDSKGKIEGTIKKKLFRRVESLSFSSLKDISIPQLLKKVAGETPLKQKEHRELFKASKDKQEKLVAAARKQHEEGARSARFEQIWRSRRGVNEKQEDDLMQEFFHLYDVVRVSMEPQAAQRLSDSQHTQREAADQLLRNYLPLLREYLPSAVTELDLQPTIPSAADSDEFVYDVYALEEGSTDLESLDNYPIVHVVEDWNYDWTEARDPDYDSQDSNDENNPINDYPEEEDDSENGCSENSSEKSDDYGSDDADYYKEPHKWYYQH